MKPIDCAEIYGDGRHYDLENAGFVDDIPFYLRLARRWGDPVLELACGTGRIAIPLALAGCRMTGLDASPAMLAQARRKAAAVGAEVEWVEADCRQFALGRRFALVYFPFNSIAHLHDRESLEGCFGCVRAHLAPGGRFAIAIFNPLLEILVRDPDRRYAVTEYPDPDGRGMVTVTENNVYDRATQVNRIRWYFAIDGQEEYAQELNMRMLYPQELEALLWYNGFAVEEKYGDFDERPFEGGATHQLVVCRAR